MFHISSGRLWIYLFDVHQRSSVFYRLLVSKKPQTSPQQFRFSPFRHVLDRHKTLTELFRPCGHNR